MKKYDLNPSLFLNNELVTFLRYTSLFITALLPVGGSDRLYPRQMVSSYCCTVHHLDREQ